MSYAVRSTSRVRQHRPRPALGQEPQGRPVWPQVVAMGAVSFVALGLLYGMSRRAVGPVRHRWGGL